MDEFDVVIIGAGPGGYVAAIRCAQLGLKTACIEKRKELGGTCLNIGCIPSKSLLQSSHLFQELSCDAKQHGICAENVSFDLSQMMQRKDKVVKGFTQGIGYLFQKNKIVRFEGTAELKTNNEIQINGSDLIRAKHIILATGSEPIELPFLPFDEKIVLSSTGALALKNVPKKMLIIGAGIIGLELGSVYKRLGAEVEFIEFLDRIAPNMDRSVSKELEKLLSEQGMLFHLSHKVTAANLSDQSVQLTIDAKEGSKELSADVVLVAIGRKPYTDKLGLKNANIEVTDKGFIKVDGAFRTSASNIFAIGDIIDGPMLAHKASEEGAAVAEVIAGMQPSIEYFCIPNVAYTHPEVASVGLTEEKALEKKLKVKAASIPMKANSRARCSGEEAGFVKMIMDEKTKQVLGIHIISANASELIAECVVILEKRMTATEVAQTCHAHPTLSEAIKEVALALTSGAIHL